VIWPVPEWKPDWKKNEKDGDTENGGLTELLVQIVPPVEETRLHTPNTPNTVLDCNLFRNAKGSFYVGDSLR
jgi:hypothetical protein